eukprot:7321707-Ditylum_brightwellii.AAC.1
MGSPVLDSLTASVPRPFQVIVDAGDVAIFGVGVLPGKKIDLGSKVFAFANLGFYAVGGVAIGVELGLESNNVVNGSLFASRAL